MQTLNVTLDDDTVHRHHRIVRSQESSLREIFRSNHIDDDDWWKVDPYENSNFLMSVAIMETTTEASMTRIQESELGVTFYVDMSGFLKHDRGRSICSDDIHMSRETINEGKNQSPDIFSEIIKILMIVTLMYRVIRAIIFVDMKKIYK